MLLVGLSNAVMRHVVNCSFPHIAISLDDEIMWNLQLMEGEARAVDRAIHPEYIDYSAKSPNWAAEQKRQIDNDAGRLPALSGSKRFPIKLHSMLSHMEESCDSIIVGWISHGRAFQIYDKQRFVKEVLPKYFKEMGKFASFQRQLNLYNFRRLRGSCSFEQKGYYHSLFLRGRPDLCVLIPRSKLSSHRVRRTYDSNSEPDFSQMVPLLRYSNASAEQQQTNHALTLNENPGSTGNTKPRAQTSAQVNLNVESQATSITELNPPTGVQFPSLNGYAHIPPTLQDQASVPFALQARLMTYAFANNTGVTLAGELPHMPMMNVSFPSSEAIHPTPLYSTLQPLTHFPEAGEFRSYGCWQASSIVPQVSHSGQSTVGDVVPLRMGITSILPPNQEFSNQFLSSLSQVPTFLPSSSLQRQPRPPVDTARDPQLNHAARRERRSRPSFSLPPVALSGSVSDVNSSSSLDMSQASGEVMAEWLEDVDFGAKC